MKLQHGCRYVRNDGDLTGVMKVTDKNLFYNFHDQKNDVYYSESGNPLVDSSEKLDCLIINSRFYETEMEVETVTISREDYDRFLEIEKAFREVYEAAKGCF